MNKNKPVISRVVYLVISLGLLDTPTVGALHCVVCLPGEENGAVAAAAEEIKEAFSGDTLSTCGSVPPPQNEDELVKKCPDGSTGCQTQRTGSWTAKTCSTVPADDCQIANGVQYCYCLGDRCNMEHPATPASSTPRAQTFIQSTAASILPVFKTQADVTTKKTVEEHPAITTSASAKLNSYVTMFKVLTFLHILVQYIAF